MFLVQGGEGDTRADTDDKRGKKSQTLKYNNTPTVGFK